MATIMANDGQQFDPDECPMSLNWNGDGTLNYIEVKHAAYTYRQSYGYTDGKVSSIGGWVKQ